MKNKKAILIIIALCLIVGGIFAFKFKSVEKKYEVATSKVNSIEVYDSCNQVNVVPSDDDQIHVKYHDRNSLKYNISEDNNVLSISNKSKDSEGGVNAGISFSSTALEIEVPKTFTGKFSAKTFDKCIVDNSIKFNNVNVVSLSDVLGM